MTHEIVNEEPDHVGLLTFPLQQGQVVNGYKLENCLKCNKYCVVYVCHYISDESTKYVTKIATKWEAKKLSNEIRCYQELAGGLGIPQLIFQKCWIQGKTEEWEEIRFAMLVIEKFEPKFKKSTSPTTKSTLTLGQLVPIAVQQISLLQFIHSRGYVHKGVKPDNFVLSKDGSKVYIIDFNKSKRFLDSDGRHIQFKSDGKRPKGLPLFHSLNYHNGLKCSRRDDMESLGFCWIYWLIGELPWSRIEKNKGWSHYVYEIGQCVKDTTPQKLCERLPQNVKSNFVKYFELCRNLNFIDEPNYERMRRLIANSLEDANNNFDEKGRF